MKTDSFGDYMNAVGTYPLLTPKQEIQLSRQVQRYVELRDAPGNRTKEEERIIKIGLRARDKLVSSNLRLVIYVAKKYSMRLRSGSLDIMDLVQEGSLGLHRAAEMFDGSKGYKFSTYSYWWIRQAITRAIDNKERLIRVPQHALAKTYKLIKLQREFIQQNSRKPTASELSLIADVPMDEMLLLFERNTTHGSLDALASDNGSPILDLLPDQSRAGEDHSEIELIERTEKLLVALSRLDDNSRELLTRHFGLDGKEPQTYASMGRAYGQCRDWIRQRTEQAKNKLKAEMYRIEVLNDAYGCF
jgi:RNA polymerase sigma factor (sigma-70 family)